MTDLDFFDLMRDTVWTVLGIAMPALIAALVVGLSIALFQALTQVQEMTLTFVPKIVAILIAIAIFLPGMHAGLAAYAERVMAMIVTGAGTG